MSTVKSRRMGKIADQLVERRGADRIEARSGLIEEKQFRIQRQGARQAGAFYHAAGEF